MLQKWPTLTLLIVLTMKKSHSLECETFLSYNFSSLKVFTTSFYYLPNAIKNVFFLFSFFLQNCIPILDDILFFSLKSYMNAFYPLETLWLYDVFEFFQSCTSSTETFQLDSLFTKKKKKKKYLAKKIPSLIIPLVDSKMSQESVSFYIIFPRRIFEAPSVRKKIKKISSCYF